MSFDAIVQDINADEAKAKGVVSGLVSKVTDRLPASVPARIEVITEKTSHLRSFATPLMVFCVIVGAYRYGGSEARADLEAYRVSAAEALTKEKQRQIDATASITSDAQTRQDDAEARATALQSRIDSYVAELRTRPVDARCTVNDADMRRLQQVGTPTRHRGRPGKPAASAE